MEPCGWSRGNAVAVEGGGEGGDDGRVVRRRWMVNGDAWDKEYCFVSFLIRHRKGINAGFESRCILLW